MKSRGETRTPGKSMGRKSYFSNDGFLMSIRDVIEEHAKSVAALNKTFRPNIHMEIDEKRKRRNRELEEKGRKIANKLSLSVHSCCTKMAKLYRCLTAEQPIRQHNKPLTHLMRPSQKHMIENKRFAEEEVQRAEEEKKMALKRKLQSFTTQSLHREFEGGMTRKGQTRRIDLRAQKKLIEHF